MALPDNAEARPGSGGTAAGTSQAPPLTVRIVDIQHALAKPLPGLDPCFSPLTGEALELVPTIRIYGATPAGQKLCLHLHGVRCCFTSTASSFSRGTQCFNSENHHAAKLQQTLRASRV